MFEFEKLNLASRQWKALFPKEPLELVWRIDETNMLYLNDIWICPYKAIEKVKVHDMGMDLETDWGNMIIIIAKSIYDGKRYIKCIERDIAEAVDMPTEGDKNNV